MGAVAEQSDRLIGARVGDYVVRRRIAEGGMGVVYEGFQPLIGKRVAIKVLRSDIAGDQHEAARLLTEARAVNVIRHRGIIDIFGFGALPDGRKYCIMEYLEGTALSDYIRECAPVPLPAALVILDEVLAALAAAHGAGVTHRDLKPSNIFLVAQPDGSSYVKLLDFGLAKRAVQLGRGSAQTSVSRIIGTPAYMAPEQARGEPVGPQTDLYALGCLTFELLTGQLPFLGANSYDTLELHATRPAPKASSIELSVPEVVDDLLIELMAKEATDRPRSAQEVRLRLRSIRRELDMLVTRLELVPTTLQHVPERRTVDEMPIARPELSSPDETAIAAAVKPRLTQSSNAADLDDAEETPAVSSEGPVNVVALDGSEGNRGAGDITESLARQKELARQAQIDTQGTDVSAGAVTVPPGTTIPPSPVPSSRAQAEPVRDGSLRLSRSTRRRRWIAALLGFLAVVEAGAAVVLLRRSRDLRDAENRAAGDRPSSQAAPEERQPIPVAQGLPSLASPVGQTVSPPEDKTPADAKVAASTSPASAAAPTTPAAAGAPSILQEGIVIPSSPPPAPVQAQPGGIAVRLESRPRATVMQGRNRLGETPLDLELPPGNHHLVLINSRVGLRRGVDLEVEPAGATEFAFEFPLGMLMIQAPEDATVFLDDKEVGRAPIRPLNVVEGEHRVRILDSDSGKEVDEVVEVTPGQMAEITLTF